jgi:GNAT superfamily N-acetyltransferase
MSRSPADQPAGECLPSRFRILQTRHAEIAARMAWSVDDGTLLLSTPEYSATGPFAVPDAGRTAADFPVGNDLHTMQTKQAACFRRLLQLARLEAIRNQCDSLRYLLPQSQEEPQWHPSHWESLLWTQQELIRLGWVRIATAIEMQRDLADTTQGPAGPGTPGRELQFASYRPGTAGFADRSRELVPLLTDILSSHQDLIGTPPPGADRLIQRWADAGRMMLTVTMRSAGGGPEEIAGLLVWSAEAQSVEDADLIRIEYMGVRTVHRRRGLASGLIRELSEKSCGLREFAVRAGRSRRLVVSTDAANDPALRLYLSAQFKPASRCEIWTSQINSERLNNIGAGSRTGSKTQ